MWFYLVFEIASVHVIPYIYILWASYSIFRLVKYLTQSCWEKGLFQLYNMHTTSFWLQIQKQYRSEQLLMVRYVTTPVFSATIFIEIVRNFIAFINIIVCRIQIILSNFILLQEQEVVTLYIKFKKEWIIRLILSIMLYVEISN